MDVEEDEDTPPLGYPESSSSDEEEAPPSAKRRRSEDEEEQESPPELVSDNEDVANHRDEGAGDPFNAYELLKARWLSKKRSPAEMMLEEFGINVTLAEQQYDVGEIRKRFNELMQEVIEVELDVFREQHLRLDKDAEDRSSRLFRNMDNLGIATSVTNDFDMMRHLIESLRRQLEEAAVSQAITDGANASAINRTQADLMRTYTMRTGKIAITVKAAHFYLELAHERGFRKFKPKSGKGDVLLYEPRVIDGHRTVSFKLIGTLHDWVHRVSSPDIAPDVFNAIFTKPGTLAVVIKYLEDTFDVRLPIYELSDYIHGFSNCYVDIYECKPYFYEDQPADMHRHVARHHHEGVYLKREWFHRPRPRREDGFWVYDHDLYETNPPTGRPTKVEFRIPIVEGRPPPPLHIPMPAAYQILDFQNFSPEMMLFFFAMIGRMLFPVGTFDTFGIILLFSGPTQSGKSTFLEAIQESLFPNRDLFAVLGSNKEETFGLGKAATCDVLFCDEMEKKPRWNLGEIKSMATGGWMAINVKHGDPIYKRWSSPVLISSNFKAPEWGGLANDVYAIVRRFGPFPFVNTIAVPDESLASTLKNEERGQLFVTSLLDYHYIIRHIGTSAFNRIAPPECRRQINEMLAELHPLVAFLMSGEVEFPPEDADEEERRSYYISLEDLSDKMTAWLKKMQIKNDNQWKPEFYKAPLLGHGCTITAQREMRQYPYGNDAGYTVRKTYVDGLRLTAA